MPVNTDIKTLSQTPSQNGPAGTDPPSTLDDAIRYALSFIAQHRDGVGFALDAIVKALGYTPVQQGTGPGQSASIIKIGWTANDGLRLAVDATNFGSRWPISIEGVAESAKYATKAGSADSAANASNANYAASAGSANYASSANYANAAGNANTVGGISQVDLVRRADGHAFALGWDGERINGLVDGGNQPFRTTWPNVDGRPENLVQRYGNGLVDVGAPDNSGTVGRAIPNPDARLRYINVISGGLGVVVDGQSYSWPINASDERLKENIRPTEEDSMAKIAAIEFVAFDFNDLVAILAGTSRKSGALAQKLEQIDPGWVMHVGEYRQLNLEPMLMSTMHALQQALARIDALEAK